MRLQRLARSGDQPRERHVLQSPLGTVVQKIGKLPADLVGFDGADGLRLLLVQAVDALEDGGEGGGGEDEEDVEDALVVEEEEEGVQEGGHVGVFWWKVMGS